MNVYGSRQDYKGAYVAVIMKMLDRIDQGLPPIIHGDGTQAYDFVNVKDCARANVCALTSDANDACFNVGKGERTTLKALGELILELTSSRLPIQYEEAPVTFVTNRIGCPETARRVLGFTAEVELRQGLEQLIAWRREHRRTHEHA
jgi:UDP-glucose 4-epimerase